MWCDMHRTWQATQFNYWSLACGLSGAVDGRAGRNEMLVIYIYAIEMIERENAKTTHESVSRSGAACTRSRG